MDNTGACGTKTGKSARHRSSDTEVEAPARTAVLHAVWNPSFIEAKGCSLPMRGLVEEGQVGWHLCRTQWCSSAVE
jgi:hypothetical protein